MEELITGEHRTLAEAELKTVRNQLRYADRQRIRAGEFLSVTTKLLKSARFGLIACIVWTIHAFGYVAVLDAPLHTLIMPILVLGTVSRNYGYSKRTHEAIVELQERSDASDA